MTVVAVIAEYNPFHLGHAHHLREIRKAYGNDCAILVLLSGNFVQRGDISVFDKYTRAECAIRAGSDLVLELPYPFSCASAELYANGAISLLQRFGCVDVLSFGSECGNLAELTYTAQNLRSSAFRERLRDLSKQIKNAGYAALCDRTYTELFGESPLLRHPNDTLALEYLNALADSGSHIQPHTVHRCSDYHTGNGLFPSSSQIRTLIANGSTTQAFSEMPEETHAILREALRIGCAPADMEKLTPHILSSLILHPPADPSQCADCGGGVGFRLLKACRSSLNLQTLLQRANTGKYTSARIRRALFHLFLETSGQELHALPAYSQLLACNKRGRILLRKIKDDGTVPILTKPADYASLPPEAAGQAERSIRADIMYLWSLPCPQFATHPLRRTPHCEK